jgi:hypothetical protein
MAVGAESVTTFRLAAGGADAVLACVEVVLTIRAA